MEKINQLHEKVWKLKEAGMNSLKVAMVLNEDLEKINELFSTSIHDPKDREMWLEINETYL